jgi:hypothetical protein
MDGEGEKSMKHTPGPWKVLKQNENLFITEDIFIVASAWTGVYKNETTDDAEANAHLIAAAPELLEACKALANVISGWDGEWQRQCGSDFVDAYAMLIAAVDKAERKP